MNRDGINGTMGPGIPLIMPKAAAFEFTDETARAIINQVKKMAGTNGGQLPVIDPSTLLILGLVLDKLDAIEKRLPPKPQYPVG